MNEISPARIGFLVDTARDPEQPYTPDMLPIFQTRDLRKGVAAALVCFRSLVESGQATVGLLAEMARYVGPAPEEGSP